MSKKSYRKRSAAPRERRGRRPGADDAEDAGNGQEEVARPEAWTVPWLVDWAKTLLFAVVIFLVLRTFVLESFVISSGSMEETMLVGDFLLVNKTSLGSRIPGTGLRIPGYTEPKRGQIIVFRADHAPGLDLVKRTIGVPGDTLWMVDGVLHRNGQPVDEPYVQRDAAMADETHEWMVWQLDHLAPGVDASTYRPTRDDWGPIVVPPERYFMLGDNRDHSLDSRYWGLVERGKMKGKPIFVYYSYDREAVKPFPWVLAMRPGRIGPSP